MLVDIVGRVFAVESMVNSGIQVISIQNTERRRDVKRQRVNPGGLFPVPVPGPDWTVGAKMHMALDPSLWGFLAYCDPIPIQADHPGPWYLPCVHGTIVSLLASESKRVKDAKLTSIEGEVFVSKLKGDLRSKAGSHLDHNIGRGRVLDPESAE